MAGGTYSAMNKKRPGAYINFESQPTSKISVGTRGIATLAAELNWGAEGSLIEVTASDLINGTSMAKIGLLNTDKKALLFNLALENASVLKVYRLNVGGEAATVTLDGGLKVTAKYSGTFGNLITIAVKSVGDMFEVQTFANGYLVNSQKVSKVTDLHENDYVTFGTEGTLKAVQNIALKDGTSGTVEEAITEYQKYFDLLRIAKWNVLAITDGDINESAISFIKDMRINEGKYVQAVISDSNNVNYEGIVNNVSGIVLADGTNVTAEEFTAWVAGAMAGVPLNESLTGKVVDLATAIINPLTNEEIINAIENGKFVLSLNQDGRIKVEKDINSLHQFDEEKSYIFSKNRVIRELDEIGSYIATIWENTYLGKVTNNEAGRTLFKSSIIDYLTILQNQGIIEDVNSDLVEVVIGDDIDTVIASIAVKPLDSMEILYMTVNVQ